MHMAVVTTGTLVRRVATREDGGGLLIGWDVLEQLGVRDGDELELHTDGSMLILTPAAPVPVVSSSAER
jgi:hypothetical protein